MDPEKFQLPKLRKTLHTKLVDIGYFAEGTLVSNFQSTLKPKLKSQLQSPKISQTAKETLLRALKKPSFNHLKEIETNRSSDSNDLSIRFYRHFELRQNDRLLTSSPGIKRGLSGYSVSKLHKSRFQIKNRSRY